MEKTGGAVAYEVINKVTGEVLPVNHLESGDENNDGKMDFIVHLPSEEKVIFTNPGYINETYVVRQADSKMSPDNTILVEDIVPTADEEVSESA